MTLCTGNTEDIMKYRVVAALQHNSCTSTNSSSGSWPIPTSQKWTWNLKIGQKMTELWKKKLFRKVAAAPVFLKYNKVHFQFFNGFIRKQLIFSSRDNVIFVNKCQIIIF